VTQFVASLVVIAAALMLVSLVSYYAKRDIGHYLRRHRGMKRVYGQHVNVLGITAVAAVAGYVKR
jgi:hypothetical protein